MFEETETPNPIIRFPGPEGGDAVRVLDGHSRILVRPEEVKEAYCMLEQIIPPGKGAGLHVHRHETEIFYIVEGEFEFQVGDRILKAGPGTNLVGPRDIPHGFRNIGETAAKLLLTIIPGHFGNYFIEVDAIPDHDQTAIRQLLRKYDVEYV